MNHRAVAEHLATIRRALYAGQISAAKVDAQRAFESLLAELSIEVAQPGTCSIRTLNYVGQCTRCGAWPYGEPEGAPLNHVCGHVGPSNNGPWYHCHVCQSKGCAACELCAKQRNQGAPPLCHVCGTDGPAICPHEPHGAPSKEAQ